MVLTELPLWGPWTYRESKIFSFRHPQGHKKLHDLDTAIGSTNTSARSPSQDHHHHLQYRRGNQFPYDNTLSDQPQPQPKSLDWSWDPQTLKSPMSPLSSSSSSWDQQTKSVGSPWSHTSVNPMGGYSLPTIADATVNNSNGLMTGSMTTTCCSSIASSGGEVIFIFTSIDCSPFQKSTIIDRIKRPFMMPCRFIFRMTVADRWDRMIRRHECPCRRYSTAGPV